MSIQHQSIFHSAGAALKLVLQLEVTVVPETAGEQMLCKQKSNNSPTIVSIQNKPKIGSKYLQALTGQALTGQALT